MIDQKKITDIVRERVLGPRPERTGPHYSAYELSRLSIRCHKWDSFNPFADANDDMKCREYADDNGLRFQFSRALRHMQLDGYFDGSVRDYKRGLFATALARVLSEDKEAAQSFEMSESEGECINCGEVGKRCKC